MRDFGTNSHPDQNHICCLYGHICPGSYGNAHVSHGQSGGVVDAVAHHGDSLSCLLQLLHLSNLVGGQHLCKHLLDAHLLGRRNQTGSTTDTTVISTTSRPMLIRVRTASSASGFTDAILGSDPCAHHHSCRGCQAKGTGTCDAQHCYGGLEGETNHCLSFGNALVVALQGGNGARPREMKTKSIGGVSKKVMGLTFAFSTMATMRMTSRGGDKAGVGESEQRGPEDSQG
ncbi:hypothetical protein EYF80_027530 [Liparis tanakae]|uniref:Uncharacterized protein n=1 Tax=Liparis tanakae TaxID=230148 RepID=A0A4Z2H906_9TELE|nr:hypothetical protein EYF80_027530 [Liparis tanakae]